MSLQHVPYSQHQPPLSLVTEVSSQYPELPKESKRSSTYATDNNGPQNLSPVFPRTKSDTQLYGPIRRRSLLQHGIATRNSFLESDPRQSLPSQMKYGETRSGEDLESYYYNSAKPTSSHIAAPRKFPDGESTERTRTPIDLSYGHTGSYMLGSLRITNGAASPSSSLDRPVTSGAEEDYLTIGDGRGNDEGSRRQGVSSRSNTPTVATDISRPPWIIRAESPLRQAHSELETHSELAALEPLTLTIDTQLPFLDPSLTSSKVLNHPRDR